MLPAGNAIFITDAEGRRRPGPTTRRRSRRSSRASTLKVMQELNARVDIDKQKPAAVATEYLKEDGYLP